MERLIATRGALVEAPLGTWIAEPAALGGRRFERVLGGWRELDEWDNPSGTVLEHWGVHLAATVLRAGYGETTD